MQKHVKPSIRKVVIERDGKCVYCGKLVAKVSGDDAPYHRRWKAYDDQDNVFLFEHFIPLADGGANDESNIVLACSRCNLEKARKEATQRAIKKGGAMSKTIKITNGAYFRLEKVRRTRETFSETLDRLLDLHDTMEGVSQTLGPSHYLKGSQPPEETPEE